MKVQTDEELELVSCRDEMLDLMEDSGGSRKMERRVLTVSQARKIFYG